MEYISLVFTLFPILLFVFGCFILLRNNDVYHFRINIISKFDELNGDKIKKIYDKYTYEQMLYSFKPLKYKYWFTKDEIEILNKSNENSSCS